MLLVSLFVLVRLSHSFVRGVDVDVDARVAATATSRRRRSRALLYGGSMSLASCTCLESARLPLREPGREGRGVSVSGADSKGQVSRVNSSLVSTKARREFSLRVRVSSWYVRVVASNSDSPQ